MYVWKNEPLSVSMEVNTNGSIQVDGRERPQQVPDLSIALLTTRKGTTKNHAKWPIL